MGLEPYGGAEATTGEEGEVWGASEKEAFGLRAFWMIAAIIFLGALVTAGVGFNCVAYLEDVGHSSERATLAWSLIMGAMILGKLTTGPIADRWGSKRTMVVVSVLFALSIFVLTFAQSYLAVMLFVAIYGFTLGAPLILNPLLTGDYLGMKNYGSLFGILNILGTLGGGLGSIGAAAYQDRHETYLPVFYVFVILMLVSAVCSLLIRPIPERLAAIGAATPGDLSITRD
jgi:MFS family permease